MRPIAPRQHFSTPRIEKDFSACSILQTSSPPWHDLSASAVKHRPLLAPDTQGHFEINLSATTFLSVTLSHFSHRVTEWGRVFIPAL